jgi:hypothetical protein
MEKCTWSKDATKEQQFRVLPKHSQSNKQDYHYGITSVDMKDRRLGKQIVNLQQKIRQSNIAGFLSVSTGILLVASAGGWDISNHLLNKPESFFSPPHAALYSGVALVIIGTILIYQCRARFRDQESNSKDHSRQRMKAVVNASSLSSLQLSVKLIYLGTTMLVSSGPFDYMWHTAFGPDGLLSPPHALLTVGMAFCSTGALIGILSSRRSLANDNKNSVASFQISKIKGIIINDSTIPDNSRKRKISASSPYRPAYHPVFVIIGIMPVWLTLSGLIHMATLPFSDTPFFNFNLNPIVAVVIATICFPFLVSFILFSSFRLCVRQDDNLISGPRSVKIIKEMPFGILTIIGITFIFVNILTSILPNEYLIPTLPFYMINILPLVAADMLLVKGSVINHNQNSNNKRENKHANYLAGAILGLGFFTFYFPLITHTYNEALPNSEPVWPSLTGLIYFDMIEKISVFLIAPAVIMGICGVVISSYILDRKETQKITMPELT